MVHRLPRKLFHIMGALALAFGFAAAGAVATATPAQAGVSYWVDPHDACREMFPGSIGASLYTWSPDGIYCYGATVGFQLGTDGLGLGAGISGTGLLNKGKVYWYCKRKHGDSYDAKVGPGWRNPMNAWWCRSPTG